MRVGFYQFSPVFGEVESNIDKMAEVLEKTEADLIVAPELATSGYLFINKDEVNAVADTVPGIATERLMKASLKSGCGIVFGMAEKILGNNNEIDKIYNSAILVDSSGVVAVYRKVHLFDREKMFFSAGDDGFKVIDYRGAKIGLLVCFDHMFPEAARTLALRGAEIICHPSNLVLPEYGQLTTRVRSIENRVFWILSNRYGKEERGERKLVYTGESQIVAPGGKVLNKAGASEERVVVVDINPDEAKSKRIADFNDLFKDRKPELYDV